MKKVFIYIFFLQNFFSESINSDIGFVGVECDSWENFEVCIPNSEKLSQLGVK